jgi:hypothetical protein
MLQQVSTDDWLFSHFLSLCLLYHQLHAVFLLCHHFHSFLLHLLILEFRRFYIHDLSHHLHHFLLLVSSQGFLQHASFLQSHMNHSDQLPQNCHLHHLDHLLHLSQILIKYVICGFILHSWKPRITTEDQSCLLCNFHPFRHLFALC